MTQALRNRRVVTGLNPQGRSCVIFDGPPPVQKISSASRAERAWKASRTLSANSPCTAACPITLGIRPAPDRRPAGTRPIRWTTSSSCRAITLNLEEGDATLHAGDVVVDRDVAHAWENRGEDARLMATVMIVAQPLRRTT